MNVTLFSSSTCAPCKTVKQFLQARGVEYNEVDAGVKENAELMMKLTGRMTTPTTLIDNSGDVSIVVGLNIPSIAKAIS